MILLILSILSLMIATVFAGLAWYVVREDRARASARIAALGSAALDPGATEVVVPQDAADTSLGLFDRRPSMRGHPLVRVAVGFVMSVAVIVFIAMAGNRHESTSQGAATASTTQAQTSGALELLSMHPDRDGDTLTVTGLVRNAGPQSAKDLTAVIFAFDRSGNFVASGRAPLEFVTLAPGDESPFRVSVPHVADVGKYRISFRTEAGVVRHVDRRSSLQATAR
jgi:hypothetical protein